MRIFDQLTKSARKFIAVGLAILVSLWLLSGLFSNKPAETDSAASAETPAGTMSVQIQAQVAQPVTRNLSIYGRTAPVRQVELKAETSGRVSELGVRRGAMAKKGRRTAEARFARPRGSPGTGTGRRQSAGSCVQGTA